MILYFYLNFKLVHKDPIYKKETELVLNRPQVIIFIEYGRVYWCVYASLGLNESNMLWKPRVIYMCAKFVFDSMFSVL